MIKSFMLAAAAATAFSLGSLATPSTADAHGFVRYARPYSVGFRGPAVYRGFAYRGFGPRYVAPRRVYRPRAYGYGYGYSPRAYYRPGFSFSIGY